MHGANGERDVAKCENAELTAKIIEIHKASRSTYGYPRIHAELKAQGVRCARKRVARLMKAAEIKGKTRRKAWRRAKIDGLPTIYPDNILNRRFETDAPDKAWVADITSMPTSRGWIHLAVVLDLYSRRVIGYAIDQNRTTDLAVNALKMALRNRKAKGGLIHHSDRGSQYSADRYRLLLNKHGIIPSMSRNGDCWDNAVVESFFSTLKNELSSPLGWPDRTTAIYAVRDYIDHFYNPRRRHSHDHYLSPQNFEERLNVA